MRGRRIICRGPLAFVFACAIPKRTVEPLRTAVSGGQGLGEQTDIASLMRWDTGETIAPESYARMYAHPRYPDAVRRYARNVLHASERDPSIDGQMKDAGRAMVGLCAIYLHASGGLTLPRLKTLFARFGLLSPGRVRALLLYLRYLGYVELRPLRERGKPALYLPTGRFFHAYRDLQRSILDALQVLEPAVGLLLDQFDAPGVFETYMTLQGDALLDGFRQAHDQTQTPYFRVFLHRHGGILILHSLLADAGDDGFPPEQPIPFSASAAARRFRVSRMQVLRLIDAAETEGLLASANGTVTFTQAGREAVQWNYGTHMILFLIAAARTLKARPELMGGAADAVQVA